MSFATGLTKKDEFEMSRLPPLPLPLPSSSSRDKTTITLTRGDPPTPNELAIIISDKIIAGVPLLVHRRQLQIWLEYCSGYSGSGSSINERKEEKKTTTSSSSSSPSRPVPVNPILDFLADMSQNLPAPSVRAFLLAIESKHHARLEDLGEVAANDFLQRCQRAVELGRNPPTKVKRMAPKDKAYWMHRNVTCGTFLEMIQTFRVSIHEQSGS